MKTDATEAAWDFYDLHEKDRKDDFWDPFVSRRFELRCSKCGLEYPVRTFPARKFRLLPWSKWKKDLASQKIETKLVQLARRVFWESGRIFVTCDRCGGQPNGLRSVIRMKMIVADPEERARPWTYFK